MEFTIKKLSLCQKLLLSTFAFGFTTNIATANTDESFHHPAIVNQMGGTFEQRNVYLDTYLFFNQTIHQVLFWELRGYYVHNYVDTAVPVRAVPLPASKDEKNLDGGGAVGILGYIFPISQKTSLMPFLRLQYFHNTSSAYWDEFGNKIASNVASYLVGLKFNMAITDIFSTYFQIYGGYQKVLLDGSGYFATASDAVIHQLTSTYELGFPYKITNRWTFTPYVQWATTTNNPNFTAANLPFINNGLTATTSVYAIKLAYTL